MIEATVGGDNVRADIQDRLVPLSGGQPFKKGVNVPVGVSKTIWDADTDSFTSPRCVSFVVDPDDTYSDGLSRAATTPGYAPKLRVLLYFATAVDGTGSALGVAIDVYRECPLVLPGFEAFTDLTGSTARYLTRVDVANNGTTGTISACLTMFN